VLRDSSDADTEQILPPVRATCPGQVNSLDTHDAARIAADGCADALAVRRLLRGGERLVTIRPAKRPSGRFASALAGSALLVGAIFAALQFSASGSPNVVIRGTPADLDTFSLTTLQSRVDRAFVEGVRRDLFEECMEGRGFSEAPGERRSAYSDAYATAAFGDDPSSTTPPPTRAVEIADGVSIKVGASWTPDTCIYQSYSLLGVDALVHEALRQQMMLLVARGDDAAAQDLMPVASRWGECLGQNETDPQDLLNTLDGIVDPLRSPFGTDAAACVSDDIRSEAMRLRSAHHLQVAADNEKVVQAWVDALDTELHEAQALAG